ncbi:MAG: superoxide dismutase, Ni [Chloroflexi bacterium]|nr:superoxide dismutase, Ni [Chloroflexota bacterium]MCH2309154.1 superoxide dismutase, Ni [SAR202 cluster bacterium]|tara:strand:- start:556 stop:1023 length:468 start_codon:yes stop_codon:yes gene_type:complete
MSIKKFIYKLFSIKVVHAHCDVPCGIYDPISAKIAAQTVLKMAIRMEAVELPPKDISTPNSMARYIAVKEEHAQLVKNELNILWSDYFKPEHLEKYPDLHDLFWNANKLAGSNKQNVSSDSAKSLVETVDKIAKIFWATKGVDYTDPVEKIRFGA